MDAHNPHSVLQMFLRFAVWRSPVLKFSEVKLWTVYPWRKRLGGIVFLEWDQ